MVSSLPSHVNFGWARTSRLAGQTYPSTKLYSVTTSGERPRANFFHGFGRELRISWVGSSGHHESHAHHCCSCLPSSLPFSMMIGLGVGGGGHFKRGSPLPLGAVGITPGSGHIPKPDESRERESVPSEVCEVMQTSKLILITFLPFQYVQWWFTS